LVLDLSHRVREDLPIPFAAANTEPTNHIAQEDQTMKTAITYRPLEEWSHDELIMLEDQLWSGWIVDDIDFEAIRTGDPSDRFEASPIVPRTDIRTLSGSAPKFADRGTLAVVRSGPCSERTNSYSSVCRR
jgi:hypothetical protein